MNTLTQAQKNALIAALEAKIYTIDTALTHDDILEVAEKLHGAYDYTYTEETADTYSLLDLPPRIDIESFDSVSSAEEYLTKQYGTSYEVHDPLSAVHARLFTLSSGKAFYFYCA